MVRSLLVLFLAFLAIPAQATTLSNEGLIVGRVVDAETGVGLGLVNVLIVGSKRGTVTSDSGHFTLDNLEIGTYTLRFSAVGFSTVVETDIQVSDSEVNLGLIEMEVWTMNLEEIVVTPGRFAIMGVAAAPTQTLTEENLKNMSWAEDITRAVSRLPGIQSTDFSSKFTIRGGEANEVLIALDGMELYEPFHQRDKAGGLFSIVDIEAVQGVDLMTGGFSSAYGNRMSGVFNMQSKEVRDEERKTTLGLSLMNARVFTQGTFSDTRGSYLFSARRGMLDQTFKLVPDAEVVPKFHDALLKVDYRLNPKHLASLHVLEAGDRTAIEDYDEEGNFDDNDTEYRNLYAWGTLKSVYNPKLYSRTIAYAGEINHDRRGAFHKYEPSDKGDFLLRDQRDYSFFGLKQDWNWLASERVTIAAGFETKQVDASYDYDIDQAELRVDGNGEFFDYVRKEHVTLKPSGNQSGAYMSAKLKVADRLVVEPGVRFDHTAYTGDDLVSPRIGVVYAVGQRTFLRAATGQYYQSQVISDLDVNNGQSAFSPAQLSTHFVVGLQHQTLRGIDIRLEAYHKDMSRLTSNFTTLRDQQEMFPEQRNDNAQILLNGARADGVEFFLKYDQGRKISWWFSYALARAEDDIRDIVFDAPLQKQTGWVARPNNQRHTLYADLNYRPSEKWHINFSFQFHKGWPRTDYTYEYLTLDNGDLHFYPVEKEFNGTPYPAYHRFDVRVNRKFEVKNGEIGTFLQVINLYNRENLRKFDLDTRNDDEEYSLDTAGNYIPFEDNVYWFGLMPVIGASWSF